jgi:hypothetical protein
MLSYNKKYPLLVDNESWKQKDLNFLLTPREWLLSYGGQEGGEPHQVLYARKAVHPTGPFLGPKSYQ